MHHFTITPLHHYTITRVHQVVKAEVAGGQGSPAKRARKKPNKAAGGKRPKISLEDY